ncbi:MAG: DUF502 domain-containing protein [Alphaproteobacteria bacterium]|nr:DUF502 domain-containing protein [Alphaproteobacteria bacterium]
MKKLIKPTLKTYFFTGILVSVPVAMTFYVIFILFDYIDSRVTELLPAQYNPETYLHYSLPGLGILILAGFFLLVGFLTANFVGRALVRVGQSLMEHVPVVSGLYNALRKIFETFLGDGTAKAFRQPVLIQYPRKGLWTIAFLTGPADAVVQAAAKRDLIGIFVPTTPNPTSGFLLYMPARDIVRLDMSVEDALKIILSMGIIASGGAKPPARRK